MGNWGYFPSVHGVITWGCWGGFHLFWGRFHWCCDSPRNKWSCDFTLLGPTGCWAHLVLIHLLIFRTVSTSTPKKTTRRAIQQRGVTTSLPLGRKTETNRKNWDPKYPDPSKLAILRTQTLRNTGSFTLPSLTYPRNKGLIRPY